VAPARRSRLIRLNQPPGLAYRPAVLQPPPDRPRTLLEFQRDFPDDEACLTYLAARRWPDGFACPRCAGTRASLITTRRVWQCSACRLQTSLTAGTVMHGTRLPLITWFWAMYLAATFNTGISARQLRRQLGIRRYETAWMLLQKIRLAMVNPDREPLSGDVELGLTRIGSDQLGHDEAMVPDSAGLLVALAVEHHGHLLGRLRIEVIPNAARPTLTAFVLRNVAQGSTLHGETWSGYGVLFATGYRHRLQLDTGKRDDGDEVTIAPGIHRVLSNLRTWLHGTHRGVGADHLERYLEEFAFRFNRRFYPMAAFDTLVGLTTRIEPTAYPQLRGPRPPGGGPRRRGRATAAARLARQPAPRPRLI
jgi:ISXO2-like transposase domain/Transposase zinc-ribbon domain